MDYLLGLLTGVTDDQLTLKLIFISLTSLTVLALVMGLGFVVLGAIDPIRLRVNRLRHNETGLNTKSAELRKSNNNHLPLDQNESTHHLMTRLAHAGYRSESAKTEYYAIRILSVILFPVIMLFALQYMPELENKHALILILGAIGIGVILPSMVLDHLIAKRKKKLRNGFPDALDMLVVCVEAGLGLQMALQRVADELSVSHPELAEELALVNTEVRMGLERMTALRNMALRTGLEDVRGLVTSLDQSIRFGTSIADTLRVYSEEFRDKRLQRAEEIAAKISTKMIFPLTFCMWPSFFLIMIGPAILGVLAVVSRS